MPSSSGVFKTIPLVFALVLGACGGGDEAPSDLDISINMPDASITPTMAPEPEPLPDNDSDGIPDLTDPDDDNDGVDDTGDALPFDESETLDTDLDGIGNNADLDDDNDGVADAEDVFPLDASETLDFDNDGVGDNRDLDDDNDGIPDVEDRLLSYTNVISLFTGEITDAAFDDVNGYVYLVDKTAATVEIRNAENGQLIKALAFQKPVERIALHPVTQNAYVTIADPQRSSFNFYDEQVGEVVVIGAANLDELKRFTISIDPFDIAVTEDYFIVAPGSGQWSAIQLYSIETGQLLDAFTSFEQSWLLKLDDSRFIINESELRTFTIEGGSFIRGDGCFSGCYLRNHSELFSFGDYLLDESGSLSERANYQSLGDLHEGISVTGVVEDSARNLTSVLDASGQVIHFNTTSRLEVSREVLPGNPLSAYYVNNTQFFFSESLTGQLFFTKRAHPCISCGIEPVPSASLKVVSSEVNVFHGVGLEASTNSSNENAGLLYRWDFDGDGEWDTDFSSESAAVYNYTYPANYFASVEVRNAIGNKSIATVEIPVGVGEYSGDEVFDRTPYQLAGKPTDIAVQANGEFAFISYSNSTVEKVNLLTGEVERSYALPELPVSLALPSSDDYLYIVAERQSSSSYQVEQVSGVVYRLNLDTGLIDLVFKTDVDPYDAVVTRSQELVISSANNYWSSVDLYNGVTGHLIGSSDIRERSSLGLSAEEDIVFALENGISRSDIERFGITPLSLESLGDSPYDSDHSMGSEIWPEPSGRYVFTNAGTVFNAENLEYVTELASSIKSITFSDRFAFILDYNNSVITVDLRNLQIVSQNDGFLTTQSIHYANNQSFQVASLDAEYVIAPFRLAIDNDGDGISAAWEDANGLSDEDPEDALSDYDEDALSALDEFRLGTNARVADSDSDGLTDGVEVNSFGTDPLAADSDRDGLSDGREVDLGTQPLLADSDGDGFSDSDELGLYNTDPTDSDSIPESIAYLRVDFETPESAEIFTEAQDSNASWFIDNSETLGSGQSFRSGDISNSEQSSFVFQALTDAGTLTFDYLVSSERCCDYLVLDVNGEQMIPPPELGLSNQSPVQSYTIDLPQGENEIVFTYRKDSSVSSASDAVWVDNITFISSEVTPSTDEDQDGLPAIWEIENGFDDDYAEDAALDADTDGLTNLEEYLAGTNPRLADSDEDGLIDTEELENYETNPLAADTDNDGLNDFEEINSYLTDPTLADTDGDSFTDGQEVDNGSDPLDPFSLPDLPDDDIITSFELDQPQPLTYDISEIVGSGPGITEGIYAARSTLTDGTFDSLVTLLPSDVVADRVLDSESSIEIDVYFDGTSGEYALLSLTYWDSQNAIFHMLDPAESSFNNLSGSQITLRYPLSSLSNVDIIGPQQTLIDLLGNWSEDDRVGLFANKSSEVSGEITIDNIRLVSETGTTTPTPTPTSTPTTTPTLTPAPSPTPEPQQFTMVDFSEISDTSEASYEVVFSDGIEPTTTSSSILSNVQPDGSNALELAWDKLQDSTQVGLVFDYESPLDLTNNASATVRLSIPGGVFASGTLGIYFEYESPNGGYTGGQWTGVFSTDADGWSTVTAEIPIDNPLYSGNTDETSDFPSTDFAEINRIIVYMNAFQNSDGQDEPYRPVRLLVDHVYLNNAEVR